MPGYVIHLAIANKFLEKHLEYHKEEFIKGTIAPDLLNKTLGKENTHYGDCSQNANIVEYLKENKLDKGYCSGYALHLLADSIFYNKYFKEWSPKMYDDYDILNKELIQKYEVELPKEVEESVSSKEGELTFLDRKLLEEFINEVANIELEKYEKES